MNINFDKTPYELRPAGAFKGKEWEYVDRLSTNGELYHVETGELITGLKVNIFAIANGCLGDSFLHKPVKLTGRRVWEYAGRGYAYECIIDNAQYLISGPHLSVD